MAGKVKKPWTVEECQRMVDLRNSGLTWREVGEAIGRSTTSVQTRYWAFKQVMGEVVDHITEEDLYGTYAIIHNMG